MTLGEVIKLWIAVKPIRRIKERRARKRQMMQRQEGNPVMTKKWHQSLTIRSLAVSAIAFVAGQFFGVGDAEIATLSARIVEWGIEGVQIGGLLVAAYGRKRAKGPIE